MRNTELTVNSAEEKRDTKYKIVGLAIRKNAYAAIL